MKHARSTEEGQQLAIFIPRRKNVGLPAGGALLSSYRCYRYILNFLKRLDTVNNVTNTARKLKFLRGGEGKRGLGLFEAEKNQSQPFSSRCYALMYVLHWGGAREGSVVIIVIFLVVDPKGHPEFRTNLKATRNSCSSAELAALLGGFLKPKSTCKKDVPGRR